MLAILPEGLTLNLLTGSLFLFQSWWLEGTVYILHETSYGKRCKFRLINVSVWPETLCIIAWSCWYIYIITNSTWIIWFLFTKELCAWNNWAWAFWSGQNYLVITSLLHCVRGQLCTSPDNLYMFNWAALSYCSMVVTVGSLSSLLIRKEWLIVLLICFTMFDTMFALHVQLRWKNADKGYSRKDGAWKFSSNVLSWDCVVAMY